MSIRLAREGDLDLVEQITHRTIREIYPRYYPEGAVAFFLHHHREENIKNDLANRRVFLCLDPERRAVGTVTVRGNEICRLFVLPQYQGGGYGSELLEFAETEIAGRYDEIILSASLPAKDIYLKRGYQALEFHTIKTENNDCLCYDLMGRQARAEERKRLTNPDNPL